MIKGIDHLGIAVKNLDAAIKTYESILGVPCEHVEEVPEQKVRTAFFKVGESHIELLQGTDADSPISKFIESRGEGIHHVALASDGILQQLADASAAGARLIHQTPVAGAGGKQVAFLHPKSMLGVLCEFCQDTAETTE